MVTKTKRMPEPGLYQMTDRRGELCSADIAAIAKEKVSAEKLRLEAWKGEIEFWEEYSLIYPNLEKARPYYNLIESFGRMLNSKPGEVWLDIGCGPLQVTELINKKAGGKAHIEAIDIVLKPARDKITKLQTQGISLPVKLQYASITDPLPFPDNYFDGIGANLVLPYVTDFNGEKGEDALESVFEEVFRVLKPGGKLVWSTPKYKVNFNWVFLASIPDMLNLYEYIAHKDFTRISQGTRILKHALTIQRKGKEGIYTFLPIPDLIALLNKVGFVNPIWEKTFAQQALVMRVCKPK